MAASRNSTICLSPPLASITSMVDRRSGNSALDLVNRRVVVPIEVANSDRARGGDGV
jgi:hypothetical protein